MNPPLAVGWLARLHHGKGLLSLKDQSRSEQANIVELEAIMYAESSYDNIRPASRVVEEL